WSRGLGDVYKRQIVYNIVDVAEGSCRLKQALIRDKRYENLYLLPAAQTKDKTALKPEQMQKIVDELKETEKFDIVLIDCPAGIETGFHNAIYAADEAIVVTTPEVSAVRDADRVIGLLNASEREKSISIIINRIRPDMVKSGDMMSVEDIIEILAVDLIGIIPDDINIVVATNRGEPVISFANSLAGKAYQNIAMRILGHDVPFLSLKANNSLWSRVKNVFRRNR
ncbi:MAG: septum site-determining protein MinD, partial [Negativicutes bacterium]|nr:septum site-determining protein MinD [Negativicutes bacterium]